MRNLALWYLRRTWPDQYYRIHLTTEKSGRTVAYAEADSWQNMKTQVAKAKKKGYIVLKVTAKPNIPEEVVYQPGRTEK